MHEFLLFWSLPNSFLFESCENAAFRWYLKSEINAVHSYHPLTPPLRTSNLNESAAISTSLNEKISENT